MNIANVQGTDKQGSPLSALKITDDNKAGRSQQINKNTESDAVLVSQGQKEADISVYREFFEAQEEKARKNEAIDEALAEDASLEETSNRMSEEDYEDLKNEGISFESYEAGRLDRALSRIKQNKEFRTEHTQRTVENKEEMESTIKKIAIGNKISDPMAKKLAQKLVEADLPVTQENVESLLSAMGMAGAVLNFSDGAKAYMIDNQLEPTVENIYHSQYSGSTAALTQGNRVADGFAAIEDQVRGILEEAGIKSTTESMEQAKWLYENELPVTAESLTTLQALNEVQENAAEDDVLTEMAKAMGKGFKPEEANLDTQPERKVTQAMDEFATLFEELNGKTDIASVTARRQLEEIRLKLTTEAGLKLLSKGITLDTTNLQGVVDGLKQIEQDYYQDLFAEASKTATPEEVELLQTTTETVGALKEAPSHVLGVTLKQREIQTVGSLHEAADSMKVRLDKAGETYEALMTIPRSDLGDSIKKAFRNVPDILEDLGIEDNEANRRAVRILSYNQMEINKDSIQEIKAWDSKVNNLLDGLKPAVTVELIKRNINPLEVTIDTLTNEVRSIQQEIGVKDEEKYSEYLWKLEHSQGISAQERESYIGIYRLLNNVEKTDGAAIGAVLNNGMEPTLKNLLSAVRSRRAAGMDVSVDDSFGTLSDLSFLNTRITDQVETSFHEQADSSGNQEANTKGASNTDTAEQAAYYQGVLERIFSAISPAKLNSLLKDGIDGLMDMTLEKLQDNLEQAIEDNKTDMEYAAHMTEKLQEIARTSVEAIDFLKSYQIEPTIKNIMAANVFNTNGKSFFKNFDKNADNEYDGLLTGFTEAIEDADTLQSKYEQTEEKVKALIDDEYKNQVEEETSTKVDYLRLLSSGIELARKLSRQECYQIPIVIGEQVATINLTLLKGTADNGKITINMSSETRGRLEGEITVKDDTIKGFILCDSKDGLETMETAKEQMTAEYEQMGLEVKQLTFGYDKKAGLHARGQETRENGVSTRLLYQVARIAVKSIGDAMQTES